MPAQNLGDILNCILKSDVFFLCGMCRDFYLPQKLINSVSANMLLLSANLSQQLSSKTDVLSSQLCDNKHAEMKHPTRSLVDSVAITRCLL